MPKVGTGATKLLPDDRYGFIILSTYGKTAVLKPLDLPSTKTGQQPAFWRGDYAVWDYHYSQDDLVKMTDHNQASVTVRLHKDGRYYDRDGILYDLEHGARFYRDYSS